MLTVLHVETRKLLVRPGRVYVLEAVAIVAGLAPLVAWRLLPAGSAQHLQWGLLAGGWATAAAVLLASAWFVAREYVDGSITSSLLGVPRRGRLLAGQIAFFGLVGAGLALLSALVGIGALVSMPLGRDLVTDTIVVVSSIGGTVVLGAGGGALGAALGVAAREHVVPAVLLLGGGYLLPSLLALQSVVTGEGHPGDLGALLPAPAEGSGGVGAQLLAAALHLGYVAVVAAVARLRLARWQWRPAVARRPAPVHRASAR